MLDKNQVKRTKKLDNMIKLANTPEEKVEKMSFREKQNYYAARSKLGKLVHNSNSGNTYKRGK